MRHSIEQTARAVDAMRIHMQIVQGLRADPATRHSQAIDHHMDIVRELARQIAGEYYDHGVKCKSVIERLIG